MSCQCCRELGFIHLSLCLKKRIKSPSNNGEASLGCCCVRVCCDGAVVNIREKQTDNQ